MNLKSPSVLVIIISIVFSTLTSANASLRDVYLDFSKNGICNKSRFGGTSDGYIFSSNKFDTYQVTVNIEARTTRNGIQRYNRQYTVPPKGQVFIGCRQDEAAHSYSYKIMNYQKVM